MVKHSIQVTVVDNSKSERCNAYCGVDWSSAEAIALASQRIRDRFGDTVKLKYLDLPKSVTGHNALRLEQQIRNEDLTLPLLIINGEIRISGQFDFRLLLDAIDAEIEMKP